MMLALKVGAIPFEEGIARAERIVLGRVTAIQTEFGIEVATIQVEKTLKGRPSKTLRFIAEPTWTCDISGANVGERGMFLLDPISKKHFAMEKPDEFAAVTAQKQPPYFLNHHGSGRLIFTGRGLPVYGISNTTARCQYYTFGAPFGKFKPEDPTGIIPEISVIGYTQKKVRSYEGSSVKAKKSADSS